MAWIKVPEEAASAPEVKSLLEQVGAVVPRRRPLSLPANEREVVWLPSGFVDRFTQDREMRRWVREDGPAVLRRHPNEAALERLAGLDVVRFNVDLQGASRRDVLQRLLQLLKPVIIELNREASNDEVGRRVHQHSLVRRIVPAAYDAVAQAVRRSQKAGA